MSKVEPIWKTKGFASEYEYLTHQAKEEGFRSLVHKNIELLAIQQGFESEADRRKSAAEKAGFESYTEYQEHWAKMKGFESFIQYQEHQIKRRGFKSKYEYYDFLARRVGKGSYTERYAQLRLERIARLKGFESHKAYQEHLSDIEKSIRLKKEDINKKTACEFLQEKIVENVDPQSLFAKGNIDFLRKITACPQLKPSRKIPMKEKKGDK